MKEPKVQAGILSESQIEFILPNSCHIKGKEIAGRQVATCVDGRIRWQRHPYDKLSFEPMHEEGDAFESLDVIIGVNFHWEWREGQRLMGALKIIVENEGPAGINMIHVGDYLTSVISSEMSAIANLELLKAHAMISGSWLLTQIHKSKTITASQNLCSVFTQAGQGLVRWYDRRDRTHFDVCIDDHCQRYQDITRALTEVMRQIIATTRG